MTEKHPAYDRIARFYHARDAAELRFRVSDARLAKAMADAGLDPTADYVFDDTAETITVKAKEDQP